MNYLEFKKRNIFKYNMISSLAIVKHYSLVQKHNFIVIICNIIGIGDVSS